MTTITFDSIGFNIAAMYKLSLKKQKLQQKPYLFSHYLYRQSVALILLFSILTFIVFIFTIVYSVLSSEDSEQVTTY